MTIDTLISQMTLEEKAGLCSGLDFWRTKPVPRLDLPNLMVSDGPHGLRKQAEDGDHLGIGTSVQAICFPAGCAMASSFDRDLIRGVGEALGEECRAENVGVLLGPAANIKRTPLCGRNFEYFSEDPYLTSEMAAEYIEGVQSSHVGTSLKHFLANNQEYRRMTTSATIDERTLREIYLAAFETAVVRAKPWTVMCSYNRVNDEYVSESQYFLTDVLRRQWGFEGAVISDWGAVSDKVQGLAAGMDLEMPATFESDQKIVEAVRRGDLSEDLLNTAVRRVLDLLFKTKAFPNKTTDYDKDKHHERARKVAEESAVLLKNDGILPLRPNQKIAFIGKFAEKPRFQGSGSSHINAYKTPSALAAVENIAHVIYEQGYETKNDIIDQNMINLACQAAMACEVAVVFAGLPDDFESEGFDRTHIHLPDCQNHLIKCVCAVQPNTVVVLHNGAPVDMPWTDQVRGILEMYLGGEAVGEATINLLFGMANPCGRLAETFPIRLEDTPTFLFYPGQHDRVDYREGIFVGYRYYDKKKTNVLFPFGHGLSYTQFAYSDMRLSDSCRKDDETLTVTVMITNTGPAAGKEVVQLYVAAGDDEIARPEKELKGFLKIHLEPGESKSVAFKLNKRSFAYFDTRIHDWYVTSGIYKIMIGQSSRRIMCSADVCWESTQEIPVYYTRNTTIGDLEKNADSKTLLWEINASLTKMDSNPDSNALGEGTGAMMRAMMRDFPLRAVFSFGDGRFDEKRLDEFLQELNSKNTSAAEE